MTNPDKVVIVEDDALIAYYMKDVCEEFGAHVAGIAADGETALNLIREERPSHILMDVRLVGPMDGVDVATMISTESPDIKIIYVTGSNEPATLELISMTSPHRILIKPINPNQLCDALS